jgi:hypothetical protein
MVEMDSSSPLYSVDFNLLSSNSSVPEVDFDELSSNSSCIRSVGFDSILSPPSSSALDSVLSPPRLLSSTSYEYSPVRYPPSVSLSSTSTPVTYPKRTPKRRFFQDDDYCKFIIKRELSTTTSSAHLERWR